MTKKTQKAKTSAEHTAMHYGFDLIEIKETLFTGKKETKVEEEKVKVLKYYSKENDLRKEIPKKMLFYSKPILKEKSAKKAHTIGLDVMGVDSALAEALVVQTALSILKEEGYKDLHVDINAIGDKESSKRFEKELTAYYRSVNEELKSPDRKKLQQGMCIDLFCSDKDHMLEINSQAPRPIMYLSEESSAHFKEVVEYLEEMDISYGIADCLMGNKNLFSKIIFVIRGRTGKEKESKILARGGRYDELASEIARKRKISAVGLSMEFKAKQKAPKTSDKNVSVHLIKLGFTARLKSMQIIEAMKHVGAPLNHSIDETKISKQIEDAIQNDAAYSLIIGHKEATNNKVLVRNMANSAQDEIKIEDLAKYMKKLV